MEYLKVTAGGKSSPKREMFRSSRSWQQRSMISNLMEAITQVSGGGDHVVSETKEDGVVRMKFKVRKQDLRQMLEVMKSGKTNAQPSPLSVEQRLNLLRRKHILRSTSMMMKAAEGVLGVLCFKAFLRSCEL
ncbi:hypothetical protein Pint_34185 [Pistacia integerrima]|uniref:Uncharacterized protein n=1 Tax=Pistacia integerrima TaxID=434235 RepID=A0ACC0X584_9ROSI|nr:hypothetical protein Pint_34185 [Pistacia integerrima]